MKIRLLLVTLVSALTLAWGVQAQDAKKEGQSQLGAHMDKIGSAFRAARRNAPDATKNAESLAQIAIIRENAQAALKLDPAKKADVPAADQAKFVADYQAKMKEFIALADKVEAALKANNNAEAEKLLGSMDEARKAGHKEFQKKKEKKA